MLVECGFVQAQSALSKLLCKKIRGGCFCNYLQKQPPPAGTQYSFKLTQQIPFRCILFLHRSIYRAAVTQAATEPVTIPLLENNFSFPVTWLLQEPLLFCYTGLSVIKSLKRPAEYFSLPTITVSINPFY